MSMMTEPKSLNRHVAGARCIASVALLLLLPALPTSSAPLDDVFPTRSDYDVMGDVRTLTIWGHLESADGTAGPSGDSTIITFDAVGRRVSEVIVTRQPIDHPSRATYWTYDLEAHSVEVRHVTFGPRMSPDGITRYDSVRSEEVKALPYPPPVRRGDPPLAMLPIMGDCPEHLTERTLDSLGNWTRLACRDQNAQAGSSAMFVVIERRIVYGSRR